MNKEYFKVLSRRLNKVDLICSVCGVHVLYSNQILTREAKQNYKCAACMLIERGFRLYNSRATNMIIPIGEN